LDLDHTKPANIAFEVTIKAK